MRKDKKKDKGFTLIELLVTIGIIAVVLGIAGYFVINTINKSKDEAKVIAINNIKIIANDYSKEYPDDIIWFDNTSNGNKRSCVSIQMLVNRGYLREKDIKNISDEYVLLEKNEQNVIIKEEFDNENICSSQMGWRKVQVPTAKEICADITYNGSEQTLTNNSSEFMGYVDYTGNKGTNAGDYTVNVSLKDNDHVWSDNTRNSKEVKCRIKKATPVLEFGPKSLEEKDASYGVHKVNISSDVGGNIKFKSSNPDYADATTFESQIDPNKQKEVNINIKSIRYINTIITATLEPNDKKNYNNGAVIFSIGKTKLISIKKPSCNDLYYNSEFQDLVKSGIGYKLSDNKRKEVGLYNVTATLKYGYQWEDKTANNVTLSCTIKSPTVTITYNNNGGSVCGSKKVTYLGKYGNLCRPTRPGYVFDGWYTSSNFSKKIDSNAIVDKWYKHDLYAKWVPRSYKIQLNGNFSDQEPGTPVTGISEYPTSICKFGQTDCKPPVPNFKYTKTGCKIYAWSRGVQPKPTGEDDNCTILDENGHPNITFTLNEEVIKNFNNVDDPVVFWACWKCN